MNMSGFKERKMQFGAGEEISDGEYFNVGIREKARGKMVV